MTIVSQQGFGKLLREPKEDVAAFSERRKAAAEAARASRSPSSSPRRWPERRSDVGMGRNMGRGRSRPMGFIDRRRPGVP